MSDNSQITLAAEFESLSTIRSFIGEACRTAAVDDDTCYDITLAVDEACTNIIQHGYAGLPAGSIILSLQYGERQFVVRLSDFGRRYEPSEPPVPDVQATFESGEMGGYGLFFIYRSMDTVAYDTTAGRNTLTLIKRLNGSVQDSG
jgi:anti-sigma regulatory factor (Ser/Thr protein kinase)